MLSFELDKVIPERLKHAFQLFGFCPSPIRLFFVQLRKAPRRGEFLVEVRLRGGGGFTGGSQLMRSFRRRSFMCHSAFLGQHELALRLGGFSFRRFQRVRPD